MKRFEGKVAMVTGGGSGIGADAAEAFAHEGATVVVTDIDEEKGRGLVEKINGHGGRAIFLKHDVSSAEETEKVVKTIVEKFGRLDTAFNNAGISGPSVSVAEYPVDTWERIISINLSGVFYSMKYEVEQMLKQSGGAIINNSSILGKVGFSNASAYTASKHGVVGLTKAAALEYASRNIRINSINPAFIKTPLLEAAGMGQTSPAYEMMVALHPVGRFGEPREVTSVVLFLASDEASFIHGESLMVDGGYTAR